MFSQFLGVRRNPLGELIIGSAFNAARFSPRLRTRPANGSWLRNRFIDIRRTVARKTLALRRIPGPRYRGHLSRRSFGGSRRDAESDSRKGGSYSLQPRPPPPFTDVTAGRALPPAAAKDHLVSSTQAI